MRRTLAIVAVVCSLLVVASAAAQGGQSVYVPIVRSTSANATPAFPNGDFEAGQNMWTGGPSTITNAPSAPVTPHGGSWVGRLAASQDTNISTLNSQSVTIPANAPYLVFWVLVQSTEGACWIDRLGVSVIDQDGTNRSPIDYYALCYKSQQNTWIRRSIDFSSYVNQQKKFEFVASAFDDLAPNSTVYIDDISFSATP